MKENNEKILSICTAVYNVEKYLGEMIESIVKSRYINEIELILVNDGSTDGSREIMAKYAEKFPDSIVIIDKENGGSGSARNLAFQIATGKYIKIIDGDDWVVTEKFDAYIAKLMTLDVDMVLNEYFKNVQGNRQGNVLTHDYKEWTEKVYSMDEKLPHMKRLAMHGITFKTSIIRENEIRLSEGISYVDMEYVTLPIPYVRKIAYIAHPFYVYRMGIQGQSIDPQVSIKKINQKVMIIKKLQDVWRNARKDGVKKSNQDIIKNNITYIATDIVLVYCGTNSFDHIKDVIREDQELKSILDADIYKSMEQSAHIKLLRKTNYKGYYLIVAYNKLKHLLTGKRR